MSHHISKTVRAVVLPVAAALLLSSCSVGGGKAPATGDVAPAHTATGGFSVVDDVGRTVTFDRPVTKAVVANRYNSELIRAMGSIDKVISVDMNTAQDRVYWKQFDPAKAIGKGQSDLNHEQIIALGPDVLITAKNGTYEKDAAKLAKAGIKVVVVTGWDSANLAKQIEILGTLFANPSGAKRLNDFHARTMKLVSERVSTVTPQKTVYWEYGDPYSTCIPGTSNDGWHQMLVAAGAVNLFGDATLAGKEIDPEAVLKGDPDLIIKTSSGKALKNTGVYTPPSAQEMQQIVEEMSGRPGWSGLKAVKGKNLYVATGFAHGGLGKVIGTAYAAKWLYPDLMRDVDPDAIFDEWMRMQGVQPIPGHVFRAGQPVSGS